MPYEDERAGLAALRAIADSKVVDQFRDNLIDRHSGQLLPLPAFAPCPQGISRSHILAIDGSLVYAAIPGALPCTEAGIVSLGMVVIDLRKLQSLVHLPESGAVNPRELRETETGKTLGIMLPGQNAAKRDGTDPRTWFREIINTELERTHFGGESLADTLHHLLEGNRTVRCPNLDCSYRVSVPKPSEEGRCVECGERILLTDGLRIHEQFIENSSTIECHNRVRDVLEILALINTLRYLIGSERGRAAISNTAFVMDGQLAAFGTIAVLARAVRLELGKIQDRLRRDISGAKLLVMSGVKSGPFVDHVTELDRAPAPGQRIPIGQVWLPDNTYIRSNIIAGGKAWGEDTHFGRPVILKTVNGQRLVLNLAQPEHKVLPDSPLTNAPPPLALEDALATAGPLGVGTDQFLALRRAHSQAAIPLRAGTDLIQSLAP